MEETRDTFGTLVAAKKKLISTKERNIALNQIYAFLNVYKTLIGNHYAYWLKEILPLSIVDTPETDSTLKQ